MNRKWIDEKCDMLSVKLGIFKPNPLEFYFEPTDEIYKKLESEEEKDIKHVANEISKHLDMRYVPNIKYDWGVKMDPEVAGQINFLKPMHDIQIPFFYVGKRYPLGRILAHEMTHAFLISKDIYLEDNNENEMLTDLGSIFIGLGKLLLNGISVALDENMQNEFILGYLSPELLAHSYIKIAAYRSINKSIMIKNLIPRIEKLLENTNGY